MCQSHKETGVDIIYLTLEEAALFLKISKSTLYKKTHKREIPYSKPGGKLIRFRRSDLEAYQTLNHIASREEIETNFLNTLNQRK